MKTKTLKYILLLLFVFQIPAPAVFWGIGREEDIEEFLKSEGAVEKFKNTMGDKRAQNENYLSPLVKQAEKFANYIDPPPPPVTATPQRPTRRIPTRPTPRPSAPVKAKFELIGTSFCATDPNRSLALIDEPGEGLKWVKPSERIGHLVVERIEDGVMVMRDGSRTFELVLEFVETQSLVISYNGEPVASATTRDLNQSAQSTAVITIPVDQATAEPPIPQPDMSQPDKSELQEAIKGLEKMKEDIQSNPDLQQGDDDSSRMLDEFIQELQQQAMSINPEEAKELEQLGRELEEEQQNDSNDKIDSRIRRSRRSIKRPSRRPSR